MYGVHSNGATVACPATLAGRAWVECVYISNMYACRACMPSRQGQWRERSSYIYRAGWGRPETPELREDRSEGVILRSHGTCRDMEEGDALYFHGLSSVGLRRDVPHLRRVPAAGNEPLRPCCLPERSRSHCYGSIRPLVWEVIIFIYPNPFW